MTTGIKRKLSSDILPPSKDPLQEMREVANRVAEALCSHRYRKASVEDTAQRFLKTFVKFKNEGISPDEERVLNIGLKLTVCENMTPHLVIDYLKLCGYSYEFLT